MKFIKIKLQLIKEVEHNTKTISSAREIVSLINKYEQLSQSLQERVILVCLNQNEQIIQYSEIARGKENCCYLNMKLLLQTALMSNSSKVIMIHNHTSGDMEQSKEDLETAEKIKNACNLLDIEFLDNIVVSGDKFSSSLIV